VTKEISRSSKGPHWKTPLCPPWICEQEKMHQELMCEFGKCPQCWRGYSEEEIDDAYRAQGINPKNGRRLSAPPRAAGERNKI
jgi:hypothetical protein